MNPLKGDIFRNGGETTTTTTTTTAATATTATTTFQEGNKENSCILPRGLTWAATRSVSSDAFVSQLQRTGIAEGEVLLVEGEARIQAEDSHNPGDHAAQRTSALGGARA